MASINFNVLSDIASFIPPCDGGRMALVCKRWKHGVDENWLSKLLRIDEIFWRSVGVKVDDLPKPDREDVLRALKKMHPKVERFVKGPLEMLPLVTEIVFPAGLTINELLQIAGKRGLRIEVDERILNEWGNSPAPRTYRALITNNLLEDSIFLGFAEQKSLAAKVGCVAIPTLEGLALLVATYISNSKSGVPVGLCRSGTLFIMNCAEEIGGERVTLSSLSNADYSIGPTPATASSYLGIGGLRILSPPSKLDVRTVIVCSLIFCSLISSYMCVK